MREVYAIWDMLKCNANNDFCPEIYTLLESKIVELLSSKQVLAEKLATTCVLLDRFLPHYHWTGFYLADSAQEKLFLGPYVGEVTDHTVISFGHGICGQAAGTKETYLIDDVCTQDNYLSCNIHVKSEIVVPILGDDAYVYAEIDIDSHKIAAFTQEDSTFLNKIAQFLHSEFCK